MAQKKISWLFYMQQVALGGPLFKDPELKDMGISKFTWVQTNGLIVAQAVDLKGAPMSIEVSLLDEGGDLLMDDEGPLSSQDYNSSTREVLVISTRIFVLALGRGMTHLEVNIEPLEV